MGMISDFKKFALGGSLIDMATGIIIGVALGGVNFSDLGIKLAETGGGAKGLEPLMLKWGAFVQNFIDFLIIMAVVFIIVKIATRNDKPEPEEEKGPTQEELLTEIRDEIEHDYLANLLVSFKKRGCI